MNNLSVALPKWVKAKVIVAVYGYTEDGIAKKRQRGIWPNGKIWRKAPDNTIMYCPNEIDIWVENGRKH